METNTATTALTKPGTLRAIFILNAFKVLLSLGFYGVFAFTEFGIEGVDPTHILYTAAAYATLFVGVIIAIQKRTLWGLRICLILDFIVPIPLVAVIGMVISVVSIGLTFTKSVKGYFGN